MKTKIFTLCLLIALLEGFAGLGIELYAIRISATYIGSSISITGVILAVVLTAIAVGYWHGGKVSQRANSPRKALTEAGKALACSALAHAIACLIQLPLLQLLVTMNANPLLAASIVGAIFGVGLAYGSTSIPLITQFLTLHYQNEGSHDAGKNAGIMVAITTVGSVLGSTVTPILLLPFIGLMASLTLFVLLLSISAALCSWLALRVPDNEPASKSADINYIIAVIASAATISFVIVNEIDTGYQTATGSWFVEDVVYDGEPAVIIYDTPVGATSSCWKPDSQKNCFWYGEQVVSNIYSTGANDILFIGGAGMAMPSEVAHNKQTANITVVDIDKALPDIVEKHFLKRPLASNISFIGDDARGYLNKPSSKRFDFTLIDAFQGVYVASGLYTLEGLNLIKDKSDKVMANVIGVPDKNHGYSQMILNNWVAVFGAENSFIAKKNEDQDRQNLLLCNFECEGSVKLVETSYFSKSNEYHTDNTPRLDRYYYKKI